MTAAKSVYRTTWHETDFGSGALIVVSLILWWACRRYPAQLPVIAPWDFSFLEFLGTLLPLFWYLRGLVRSPRQERPNLARQLAFISGVAMIYTVLQTHFVYMSQHMFFLNRVQHLAMHHLAPFLIALSWPGDTIGRGMPAAIRLKLQSRLVKTPLHVVQNPVVTGVLFVGLISLWLQPSIHFHAMVSPVLYDIMNWSMVIDGLLFWFFALDPRPAPPARSAYAVRLLTVILVIFPQILIGARITFGGTALYNYYDLCGRLFPSVSALHDQHLGGLIVWIPSSMMSSITFLLIMNNVRLQEDKACGGNGQDDIAAGDGIVVSSSSWTGR